MGMNILCLLTIDNGINFQPLPCQVVVSIVVLLIWSAGYSRGTSPFHPVQEHATVLAPIEFMPLCYHLRAARTVGTTSRAMQCKALSREMSNHSESECQWSNSSHRESLVVNGKRELDSQLHDVQRHSPMIRKRIHKAEHAACSVTA